MVRGDRITHHHKHTSAVDLPDGRRFRRQVLEERRFLHIGAVRVPGIQRRFLPGNGVPGLVAVEYIAILCFEHLGLQRLCDGIGDFLLGGPDVLQGNRISFGILTQGLARQVHVNPARQGVGHHQGRRGEVVRLHVRVYASLEIPVARQDRCRHQVAFVDRLHHRLRQRTAVADAGGATVSHRVESEAFQVGRQPRRIQIIRHHAGSGRQACLYVRGHREAPFHGLFRQKPRAHHHRGIARIRATRDRRDHHRAVSDPGPAVGRHGQLPGANRVIHPEPVVTDGRRQRLLEALLHGVQRHTVLRPFRPGQTRFHRAQIHLERFRKRGFRRFVRTKQTLRPGIPRHQVDRLRRPGGALQVSQRLVVHGKESHGRAVFGRHIRNGCAVGQADAGQPRAVELHELADHPFCAQHLGDRQRQVRGGRAVGQTAVQLEAHDLGRGHIDRLPEHNRFGLDPANPPSQHAQSVDHCGMRVRSDQAVRKRRAPLAHNALRQIFQVHLMDDSRGRRHHLKLLKRIGAPPQELIAFPVPFEFDLRVDTQRVVPRKPVDLDRMVDDQVGGYQRLDPPGVLSHPRQGGTQRGQVHQGWHAGEVLQYHARRHEGDLRPGGRRRIPSRQLRGIVFGYQISVQVPKRGLQQHLDGEGQSRNRADAGRFQSVQPIDPYLAPGGRQLVAQSERILDFAHNRHPQKAVSSQRSAISSQLNRIALRPGDVNYGRQRHFEGNHKGRPYNTRDGGIHTPYRKKRDKKRDDPDDREVVTSHMHDPKGRLRNILYSLKFTSRNRTDELRWQSENRYGRTSLFSCGFPIST